jgi:putative sigma-54 modulation protein
MEIIVTGRHLDVSDSLKTHAIEKIQSMLSEYRKIISVKVILDQQKTRSKAEIIVHGKNMNYEAESESYDIYKSIDEAIIKMNKQIAKHFDKVQDHHKKEANNKEDISI